MTECTLCRDAVKVALNMPPLVRVSAGIWILRCPQCRSLILDDINGWRGSGVVFRGSAEEILKYLEQVDPRLITPEVRAALREP